MSYLFVAQHSTVPFALGLLKVCPNDIQSLWAQIGSVNQTVVCESASGGSIAERARGRGFGASDDVKA